MNKQHFELGTKVWCFKGGQNEINKAIGYISGVMINSSGRLQYTVKVWDKSGSEPILREWQTNEASMALTEAVLQHKIETYINFTREQRLNYERTFGKEEFDLTELGELING